MDQITDRRQAAAVMGDHPVVGLVTAFADPLWLAVPHNRIADCNFPYFLFFKSCR
jgi:hypothetical protein